MTMPIFFIPINYPERKTFFQLMDLLAANHVKTIELGIPVTNAYQDGPLIQKINRCLLQNGLTINDISDTLKQIKQNYEFKIVIMTYYEGIQQLRFGQLDHALYDAILCVDHELPKEIYPNIVSIISPGLSLETIRQKVEQSNTFIYLTSSNAKTGSLIDLKHAPYKEIILSIRQMTSLPIYVGFGIKNNEDVQRVIENGADGSIIGSQLLKHYETQGLPGVSQYLQTF
ncbi:tryptophan synthase subunit alpha [Xylocopilactobacillus apicola]|uniref:tryptophan synthase n=1 Tax=Xylocopilactobacillus apicola TaxID=2932184 RepID=A0AAU9DU18_9LACO|nr:tryptophan synthase subunit alpha [Xylocopilactobacillus apicola]BDR59689.1 tryptophan synthase alpha chain [Xylocopilactobacillus apicola]